MILYMSHVRAAKLCSRGLRAWFKANNLDWDDFLLNGIDSEIVAALDDGISARVIEIARKEQCNGR